MSPLYDPIAVPRILCFCGTEVHVEMMRKTAKDVAVPLVEYRTFDDLLSASLQNVSAVIISVSNALLVALLAVDTAGAGQRRLANVPVLVLVDGPQPQAIAESLALAFETAQLIENPSATALWSALTAILTNRRRQLERQAQELKDAKARNDTFLATLAHELRNPLAPLCTGIELLKQHGDNPAATVRVREVMARQLTQMVRLVDDLVDVARITSGQFALRSERVDLRDVIEEALETSEPLVKAARQKLDYVAPLTPLWVKGDPARLVQVVTNIVNNAAKYSHDEGTITVTPSVSEHTVIVRIRDQGLGIPTEVLPNIFSLFCQVNQTLERAQGGLGIGLALVRQLVERHEGSIEAESAGLYQGSTFTLRLPLYETVADPNPPTKTKAETVAPPRPLRILVVDDNLDGADLLAMLLEDQGHHATVAYDGPAALDAAARILPELVFCDIGLPGMSGYDVARKLRQMPALGNATLVALTGLGSKDVQAKAKDSGFDLHLTKPLDAGAMKDILGNVPRA